MRRDYRLDGNAEGVNPNGRISQAKGLLQDAALERPRQMFGAPKGKL
jgi:hypothetical protein